MKNKATRKTGFFSPYTVLALILVCFVLFAACKPAVNLRPDYFPTQGWKTDTPENRGVDSKAFASLLDYIDEQKYGLDSVCVYKNGYKILEACKTPYDTSIKHRLYSVTKSVTALLYGMAVDKGLIEPIDTRLVDMFPDRKTDGDANRALITPRHLLSMTGGMKNIDADLINGNPDLEQGLKKDALGYFLSIPMYSKPGGTFSYSNAGYQMLSVIFQEKTGRTLEDFAKEFLFTPLGITDFQWVHGITKEKYTIGYDGLYLTPDDLAKIGLLFLSKGEWDGARIAPKKWFVDATKRQIATGGTFHDYGLGLWLDANDFYAGIGSAGQGLIIDPKTATVTVIIGHIAESQIKIIETLYREKIRPALGKEPIKIQVDATLLAQSLSKFASIPPLVSRPAPAFAAAISGREILFNKNNWGWGSMTLFFDDNQIRQIFKSVSGIQELYTIGLSGTFIRNDIPNGPYTEIIHSRAAWIDGEKLRIEQNCTMNGHILVETFTFSENAARIDTLHSTMPEYPGNVTAIITDQIGVWPD